MKILPEKISKDGRSMLNIACGTITDSNWNNIDFSPYALLAKHKIISKMFKVLGLLSKERYRRLSNIAPDIIYWDLRRGMPFHDETMDVIYCSHYLEHINRDTVLAFLRECYRVLKKGGLIRIVVPDLESIIKRYSLFINNAEKEKDFNYNEYKRIIYDLFDQMVREKATGASEQKYSLGKIESFFRGNAAKTGELHRWMYDRYCLKYLLAKTGFDDYKVVDPLHSRIEGWIEFNLDTFEDGTVRHPGSIYMECIKM